MKISNKKRIQVGSRVLPETLKKLETLSADKRWTVSATIAVLLETHPLLVKRVKQEQTDLTKS